MKIQKLEREIDEHAAQGSEMKELEGKLKVAKGEVEEQKRQVSNLRVEVEVGKVRLCQAQKEVEQMKEVTGSLEHEREFLKGEVQMSTMKNFNIWKEQGNVEKLEGKIQSLGAENERLRE